MQLRGVRAASEPSTLVQGRLGSHSRARAAGRRGQVGSVLCWLRGEATGGRSWVRASVLVGACMRFGRKKTKLWLLC